MEQSEKKNESGVLSEEQERALIETAKKVSKEAYEAYCQVEALESALRVTEGFRVTFEDNALEGLGLLLKKLSEKTYFAHEMLDDLIQAYAPKRMIETKQ